MEYMKRSTSLRLFGAAVLLFNIWLIGQYRIKGDLVVVLLTFGFAIGYEYLVVRPFSAPMAASRINLWKNIGIALASVFFINWMAQSVMAYIAQTPPKPAVSTVPAIIGYVYSTRIGVTNQDCKPLYPRATAVYSMSASGKYGVKGCMEKVNYDLQAITWLLPSRMPVRMVQSHRIKTDTAGIAALFKPDYDAIFADPNFKMDEPDVPAKQGDIDALLFAPAKPVDWSQFAPVAQ